MSWLFAILYLLTLAIGWVLALVGLGGTWIMVGVSVLYAWLIPATSPFQLGWTAVISLAVLAALLARVPRCGGRVGPPGGWAATLSRLLLWRPGAGRPV